MPAVDDPFSIAASLPGQMATLKGVVKDLSVNNTQALTQALAAATSAASSASSASAAATAAANAANAATIVPQVGSAGINSYTLTTSYATYATFNFTVPSGFTQVYINAGGSVTAISQYTAGEIGYARILINGSAGTEGRALFIASGASASAPAIPAFAVLGIGGLTAGATIQVALQCRLGNGPGLLLPSASSASVSGTALFFR